MSFRMLIEGEASFADGRRVGFLATRFDTASKATRAESKAWSKIVRELRPELTENHEPKHVATEFSEVSWLDAAWLGKPRRGFTFWDRDAEDATDE